LEKNYLIQRCATPAGARISLKLGPTGGRNSLQRYDVSASRATPSSDRHGRGAQSKLPSNTGHGHHRQVRQPAPSLLTATAASATQINLAWTNQRHQPDGFQGWNASPDNVTFAQIGTAGASATSLLRSGICCRRRSTTTAVRATNASGDSAYSNVFQRHNSGRHHSAGRPPLALRLPPPAAHRSIFRGRPRRIMSL